MFKHLSQYFGQDGLAPTDKGHRSLGLGGTIALWLGANVVVTTILTGMRISVGIAWLVIVAAEMLVGGTGIGYYVWNEWNNLNLASVIFSILMIGVVGMLLDQVLARFTRMVTFPE